METKVSERLQRVLDYFDLDLFGLAQKIGYKRSEKLKRVLEDKGFPSFDLLLDLKKGLPTLSLDWFITGRGSMIKEESGKVVVKINHRSSIIPFISISEAYNYPLKFDDPSYISSLPVLDDVAYNEEIYRDFEIGSTKLGPEILFKDIVRAQLINDPDPNMVGSFGIVKDKIQWIKNQPLSVEDINSSSEIWKIIEVRKVVK